MSNSAYKIQNFIEIPIKSATRVSINGKLYSPLRNEFLKKFIARLLGAEAEAHVFPSRGNMNGLFRALIYSEGKSPTVLTYPTIRLFDVAVWTLVDPNDEDAKKAYAHYQRRMEEDILSAAAMTYYLSITAVAASIIGDENAKNAVDDLVTKHAKTVAVDAIRRTVNKFRVAGNYGTLFPETIPGQAID